MIVEANGQEFEFSDSATPEQIGRALNEYFAANDKHANDGAFVSYMAGAIGELNDAGNAIREFFGGSPELAQNMEVDKRVEQESQKNPIATGAGKITGQVAPAVIGGFAASSIARPAISVLKSPMARAAADAAASSVGGQLMTGQLSADQTAVDTALGVVFPKVLGWAKPIATGMLRGKDLGKVAEAAARVGVAPTRAMTTGNRVAALTENKLANTLGSSGLMHDRNVAILTGMDEFANEMAAKIAGGRVLLPGELGDAIRKGYTDVLNEGRDLADAYYRDLYKMAGAFRMKAPRTRAAIAEIALAADENPAMKEILVAPAMKQLGNALAAGNQKGMTVRGALGARKAIDNLIDNVGLGLKAADKAELIALRTALTDDIEQQLNDSAAFGVYARYRRANDQWRAFREAADAASPALLGNKAGNELYDALFGLPAEGMRLMGKGQFDKLMAVLPEPVQKQVKAEMWRRAGLETAATSTDNVRRFSPAIFSTNWTKFSEQGYAGDIVGGLVDEADALALLSNRLKTLGRGANYSNTANMMNLPNIAAVATAIPTGGVALAATALTANAAARFLTSPKAMDAAIEFAAKMGLQSATRDAIIRAIILTQQDVERVQDGEAIAQEWREKQEGN